MSEYILSEEEHLIKFAVDAFNAKFKKNIDPNDCGVRSISPSYGYSLGYRVTTLVGNDYIYIHLYVNPSQYSKVTLVQMEVVENLNIDVALGDEVYVVTGDISHDNYRYLFQWLDFLVSEENLIYFSDGDYATNSQGAVLTWS